MITQQHFILHFNQLGYDSVMVASAYGIIGIMLIIFKLGFGTLSTKFNFGTISCVFLGFYVVSCICAAGSQFITSPALVYGACATLGVAGAVTSLGYPNWVADTHPENYAKTAKNAQASYQGLEVLGSLMPGVLLDLTGHYTAAYILNGVIFALVAVIVFIAYSSTRKKAWHGVSWTTLIIVGGSIGISAAIAHSGVAEMAAKAIIRWSGSFGTTTLGLCIILFLVTTLFSNVLAATSAVAIMMPIIFSIASTLGMDVVPLVLACTSGSKFALSTPICTGAMTMIGVPGYRAVDYFRMGGLVNIICLVVTCAVLALIF